jgi:hypothetical protein
MQEEAEKETQEADVRPKLSGDMPRLLQPARRTAALRRIGGNQL